MADDSSTSPKTTEQTAQPPGPDNPVQNSDQPDSSTPVNPNPTVSPQIQSYAPPQVSTVTQSFWPATPPVPLPTAPQFSPLPNPNFQNPGVHVQPPGVSPLPVMMPPSSGGAGSVPQMMPPQYAQQPNPALRMYAPMPNGYSVPVLQGMFPPPVY